jgi:peptide deformylase
MSVRTILKMGDPRLMRPARMLDPADFGSAPLRQLLTDLEDTMHDAGGVGIAAPQIGVDLAVVLFGFERSERYPEAPPVPRTVLINPVITVLDAAEDEGWEGCLSVPGLRGWVPRARSIRYSGFDPEGRAIEREAAGFHARVVQHECDHLLGTLYPARVRDFSRFGFIDALGLTLPAETSAPQPEAP